MLRPILVTPPAAEIVSLDDAKVHLRVDGTDDDDLITMLEAAAEAHLDGYSGVLGRCLIDQVWRQDFVGFDWCLRLPFPDVSAIGSVKYYDTDNVQQTIDSANYQLLEDERSSFVQFTSTFSWPSTYYRPDPVSVQFTAGYGAAADDVPAAIRAAILLTIGHLYANREAVGDNTQMALPLGVDALITPYRRVGV